jgi:hypothetical protein
MTLLKHPLNQLDNVYADMCACQMPYTFPTHVSIVPTFVAVPLPSSAPSMACSLHVYHIEFKLHVYHKKFKRHAYHII